MGSPARESSLTTTFPIPGRKIRARKLILALKSPFTWIPFFPVVIPAMLAGLSPLMISGLTAAVAGAVGLFWKLRNDRLTGKLLQELVDESNRDQDRELIRVARQLLEDGHPQYASTLGSFLEKKRAIEKGIHADGAEITPRKEEFETLVDTVTFGVADQLVRLVQLERMLTQPAVPVSVELRESIECARQDIAQQIRHAWETVSGTWDNLGSLLDPGFGVVTGEEVTNSRLDEAISKLTHEKEIAARVRKRMAEEWGDRFGDPPVDTETGFAQNSRPASEIEE